MSTETTSSEQSPSDVADAAPPFRYNAALAAEIELHWQDVWESERVFETPNPAGSLADPDKVAAAGEKLFVLDMFPYPSDYGLHVGHPFGYIGTDAYSRYARMAGRNVLYTMGFDAFGLPAEQFAVQTGQHPAVTTAENVANYRTQLRRLGMSHDRRRSIETTDPAYYRWRLVPFQHGVLRAARRTAGGAAPTTRRRLLPNARSSEPSSAKAT
jgi:leucyl-tRNA synthetase